MTVFAGPDAMFRLRPLGAQDRDRVAALFARMSARSRYRRFLAPKARLTAQELTYLVDVDHIDHEVIAAVDRRDGSIVAVVRYVRYRSDAAEISVEVADEWHRMGIGSALTSSISERARSNGIATLTATTLRENRAARVLARRVGFRAIASHGSLIELELRLPQVAGCAGCLPAG